MHLTHVTSQYAVYDDVLPLDAFRRFWHMFRNTELNLVHARGVSGYYRPSDGIPYEGPQIAWTTRPLEEVLPDVGDTDALPIAFYPVGDAHDDLVRAMQDALRRHPELVGRENVDWVGAMGRIIAYPPGTSISWHADDDDVTASVIYYANPHWDVQWGGELFVADESTKGGLRREASLHEFESALETEVLLTRGIGTYVMPKPNRLVLLAGANPHKVAKVASNAGDHVRASFSAFLIRPGGVEALVRRGIERAMRT
ncbi:MAG: 2OG-Fe(II) oxygenase [Polyangiales bacterium]